MKKKILIVITVLLLIASVGAAGYYFKKHRDLTARFNDVDGKYNELIKDPQAAQAAEARRYVEEVGKVYDLPKGEEPNVATVSDKEKLKDQPFFAKAENGDIALIYSQAKLAVLYRPSTKQLVNVSSVTIQEEAQPAPDTNPDTAPETPLSP
ncbi:hypothetical protein H0X10_01200 [Candidatus Saccharibacteria bacterium]|nr:hypothetical protein [Candidatus Saccharibacteria bacterium]